MPRLPAPLAFLIVALVVGACSATPANSNPPTSQAPVESVAPSAGSAGEDPPPAGTDLDACEIVTAGDIAAATGLAAGGIAPGELAETPTVLSPGHSDCDYLGEWGGVIVSLTPDDGANLYDAARGAYDDASDREVTGADGAFWSESTGRGFFWKGAVTVMLQVGFLADGGSRDAIVTTLGQAALDRVD